MRVTTVTLAAIAKKVSELERVGADVPELRVHGYRVTLERQDSQRDGLIIWITGIEPLSTQPAS